MRCVGVSSWVGILTDMSPIRLELCPMVISYGVALCKWGSGLLKSRLCFLTSKNHKQDYKQRGTTTWG